MNPQKPWTLLLPPNKRWLNSITVKMLDCSVCCFSYHQSRVFSSLQLHCSSKCSTVQWLAMQIGHIQAHSMAWQNTKLPSNKPRCCMLSSLTLSWSWRAAAMQRMFASVIQQIRRFDCSWQAAATQLRA